MNSKTILSTLVLLGISVFPCFADDIGVVLEPVKSSTYSISVEERKLELDRRSELNQPYFSVKVTLTNTSSVKQQYWTQDCGTSESFKLDNKIVRFFGENCDSTDPRREILKAGESRSYIFSLKIISQPGPVSFKVAFVPSQIEPYYVWGGKPDEIRRAEKDGPFFEGEFWSNELEVTVIP